MYSYEVLGGSRSSPVGALANQAHFGLSSRQIGEVVNINDAGN